METAHPALFSHPTVALVSRGKVDPAVPE